MYIIHCVVAKLFLKLSRGMDTEWVKSFEHDIRFPVQLGLNRTIVWKNTTDMTFGLVDTGCWEIDTSE